MKKISISKYIKTLQYVTFNYLNRESIYPFYASFKITNKCGRRCSFCNVWMESTPELPTKDVYRLLDNLGKSSISVLSIEGGDPLMRKDLGEILKYAHTKPFILFFTTDGLLIDKRPMKEYGKYIDFLHISIDEGHRNLDYFERLEDFQKFGVPICIQIVVTKYTLDSLEEKVKKVHEVGARTVVMPATHLSNTENAYPDPQKFSKELYRLKKKYKNTITTSYGFLKNINKQHGCSTTSLIIDCDGGLYYPCRMLGYKPYYLTSGDLFGYLQSDNAKMYRNKMKYCNRRCGWYQYFATDSFVSPLSFIQSLRPYL